MNGIIGAVSIILGLAAILMGAMGIFNSSMYFGAFVGGALIIFGFQSVIHKALSADRLKRTIGLP